MTSPVTADTATPARPPVVCLCGSMRFEDEIRHTAINESLAGRIVLMPHVNIRDNDPRWVDRNDFMREVQVKEDLDALHLAKIDLADEVLIICPGGYIGESTAREIAYAQERNIPVRYRDTWEA